MNQSQNSEELILGNYKIGTFLINQGKHWVKEHLGK